MVTTELLLAQLRRRIPDGVRGCAMALEPYSDTATEVTYRAAIPRAGTVLGVHFPGMWPTTASVVMARWVTGESIVVATIEMGAMAPARALRLIKFWNQGGQSLEIRLSIPPTAAPNATQIAKIRTQRPVILLVEPVQTGLAKVVRWAQGGLARLGRAATP